MKNLGKMMALLVMSMMMLSVVSCSNPASSGSGGGGTGSDSGGAGAGGGNSGGGSTPIIYNVSSVSLDVTNAYCENGETLQLTATIKPNYATDKTVRWSTSDENIATVDDNGLVTIVNATAWEIATITVTTNDGDKSANCDITIIKKPTATAVAGTDFVEISDGSMPLYYSGEYQVTLTKAFKICDHEVTQEEYEKYCIYSSSSPSETYGIGANYPAYNISWYDAIVYCNLRSMAENLTPCYKFGDETNPKNWVDIQKDDETNPQKYCGPAGASALNNVTCNFTAFQLTQSGNLLRVEV